MSKKSLVIALAFFFQLVILEPVVKSEPKKDGTGLALESENNFPNLYFSPSDLSRLRHQAHTSHANLYRKLTQVVRSIREKNRTPPPSWETFTAVWNERYGNNFALLAMYCLLTPHDREAFDLAKDFMDKLTRYPSWRVQKHEHDDVPVAHSLLGFVTIFDFLYQSFTSEERLRYVAKIRETGAELYESALTSWWGKTFIHNHVVTNHVALLTAAIVITPYHEQEANKWRKQSVILLNATMKLLNMVVDGSFEEGVTYGTYTMRSLTQFMYLMKRHFNYSYKNNSWVRKHFEFLLYTTLPGYQKTIGIADSVEDWAYGPESQLIFLESYVNQGGRALWLANQIKQKRPKDKRNKLLRNMHSTLHTEFLFHNSNNRETPLTRSIAKLHVFSDWGVISYGGGTPAGHVFLSFKCGRLHGRAVNTLRRTVRRRYITNGFSPGHEQPDHGSFVFMTKEQAVVTDSFYGPKYTFLQNTLMFRMTEGCACTASYQGQMGEGSMWLNHFDQRTWKADGDLIGYSRHGDVIFMSGDFTGWYDQSLGLENVYRALVMLSPTVLVVIDTIRLRPENATTHASAFFHNVDIPFKNGEKNANGLPCAVIGIYSICWTHLNARTINATIENKVRLNKARYATNFINVTYQMLSHLSSTVYVFHNSHEVLQDLKVSQATQNGIKIDLKLLSKKHVITLSTRHENPRLRRTLLGSNAYGKLSMHDSTVVHLGLRTTPHENRPPLTKPSFLNQIKQDKHPEVYCSFFFYTTIFLFVTLAVIILFNCTRRFGHRFRRISSASRQRFLRNPSVRWKISVLFILWFLTHLTSFFMHSKGLSSPVDSILRSRFTSPEKPFRQLSLDALILTGLPSNGADIARELFTTNTDFITIDIPSENILTPPSISLFYENLDFCEWINGSVDSISETNKVQTKFQKWWYKLLENPLLLRKNDRKDYVSVHDPLNPKATFVTEVQKSKGVLGVVHFKNPGWIFRVSWINSRLLRNNLTPVLYIVRDPRSWIEQMLLQDTQIKTFLRDLNSALRSPILKKMGCEFPFQVRSFQELELAELEHHVILAHIWVAFVSYASKLMADLPSGRFKIVHMESLILSPQNTAEDIYSFLEMPFTAAVEHRILQVTKTGVFKFENYGVIDERLTTWGKILGERQVLEITGICGELMKRLGYS